MGKAVSYAYLHGHAHLAAESRTPEFSFGHGLSYTQFAYETLRVSAQSLGAGETLDVDVRVQNVGKRAGTEIVQLYASYVEGPKPRPGQRLVGFGRLELAPGETRTLRLRVSEQELGFYHPGRREVVLPQTSCTLAAGPSCRELPLSAQVTLR